MGIETKKGTDPKLQAEINYRWAEDIASIYFYSLLWIGVPLGLLFGSLLVPSLTIGGLIASQINLACRERKKQI